jgi:hypothetical protein
MSSGSTTPVPWSAWGGNSFGELGHEPGTQGDVLTTGRFDPSPTTFTIPN